MKALIVDDEYLARTTLHKLIVEFCPAITSVEEAEDVPHAISHIRASKPDIVFLDIEMPGISGIHLVDYLDKKELTFKIIFITAYSKYAVEAFRLSAIDYLLKPVSINELKKAVEKTYVGNKNIEVLQENLKDNEIKRIVVSTGSGREFIRVQDIYYLEAEGAYTYIHLKSGKRLIISKGLKEFKQLSDNGLFFKCHRSYMINIAFIKGLTTEKGLFIILEKEQSIPLSKRKKTEFIDLVNQLDLKII
jgi:two-component system LytT family response regulator